MKQEDNIYIYKNSFLSLLTLIKYLIDNKKKPLNIKNEYYVPSLFDTMINLQLQENEKIIDYWYSITSFKIIKIIYYIFLSDNENKELIIFYFLLNSIKYKDKIIYMRNLNCVNKALKISHKVSNENHRFKGFTRFKELKNHILYAEISPDNNILFLLSYHFKNRLKNEYWIIKDSNHEIISLYDKKRFYILDANNFKLENIEISTKEETFETLWKSFYKIIGIEERKNNRCRMNFMPKKYWKNIIEMSDEIEKSNN